MEEQGYLTKAEEADDARDQPGAPVGGRRGTQAGGYFADWVMETAPAFLARDTTEDVVIQHHA